MPVVAFDPIAADADFEARHGIARLGLDDLLATADVVSLHSPLTPETHGLINRATLARMRPGSYLINTSRGGLVVEADLAESLASGHLAGAGLDVLNAEPPEPGNPLLNLANVVLSPHMGGIDVKSMADMADMAARCIVALHRGEWPAGVRRQQRAGGRLALVRGSVPTALGALPNPRNAKSPGWMATPGFANRLWGDRSGIRPGTSCRSRSS